ncbi:hypothetical protein D5086_032383 [Populus alba]|uniref:Uncharacterized protein n=1 Tax=Populus alba TaxID=43335 RepID=A0ACC4AL58_POPAL
MMNQAISHLGALSSLMSDASSNCRRQPGMGTSFTAEKILDEVQQDGGKRKKHCGDDNKESSGNTEFFKPYDRELSGSTKFSSPASVIPSGLRQVTHYNETTLHILSIWVAHHNETTSSYFFHLGRSPITMRPHFIFFSILGRSPITMRPSSFLGHPKNETTLSPFHLGRSPITMRPPFPLGHPKNETTLSPFHLGRSPITMRPPFFLGHPKNETTLPPFHWGSSPIQ